MYPDEEARVYRRTVVGSSRRPSPRSSRSYAGPAPGHARPCWRRWAKHYPRSASGMPRDSSSMPVTILWVNYYEICCQNAVWAKFAEQPFHALC